MIQRKYYNPNLLYLGTGYHFHVGVELLRKDRSLFFKFLTRVLLSFFKTKLKMQANLKVIFRFSLEYLGYLSGISQLIKNRNVIISLIQSSSQNNRYLLKPEIRKQKMPVT